MLAKIAASLWALHSTSHDCRFGLGHFADAEKLRPQNPLAEPKLARPAMRSMGILTLFY